MSVSEFLIAYVQIKEAVAALTPSPVLILLGAIAAAVILGWRLRGDLENRWRISRRIKQRFAAVRA